MKECYNLGEKKGASFKTGFPNSWSVTLSGFAYFSTQILALFFLINCTLGLNLTRSITQGLGIHSDLRLRQDLGNFSITDPEHRVFFIAVTRCLREPRLLLPGPLCWESLITALCSRTPSGSLTMQQLLQRVGSATRNCNVLSRGMNVAKPSLLWKPALSLNSRQHFRGICRGNCKHKQHICFHC